MKAAAAAEEEKARRIRLGIMDEPPAEPDPVCTLSADAGLPHLICQRLCCVEL